MPLISQRFFCVDTPCGIGSSVGWAAITDVVFLAGKVACRNLLDHVSFSVEPVLIRGFSGAWLYGKRCEARAFAAGFLLEVCEIRLSRRSMPLVNY